MGTSIAVLIPSFGRPHKLHACLQGLAAQSTPPDEILVGIDGGAHQDAHSLQSAFAHALPMLRALPFPKQGYIPIRAELLRQARADLFLSLNDDVIPHQDLIQAHLNAHHQAPTAGFNDGVLVTGPAPWIDHPNPTLFDALIARTGIIFFDPAQRLDDQNRLPYRYCVGLNFSCPTKLALDAGGFHNLPETYGYDDIELAHRIQSHSPAVPVLYESAASLTHDHRYTPLDVMRREYQLGRAAWAYRNANPAFSADLFRRDIASESEQRFSESLLTRFRADAQRIEARFLTYDDQPLTSTPHDDTLHAMAEHWTLLKRYLWHWGLHDATKALPPRFAPLASIGDLP